MVNKFNDFKKYESFCKENGLTPCRSESLSKYMATRRA